MCLDLSQKITVHFQRMLLRFHLSILFHCDLYNSLCCTVDKQEEEKKLNVNYLKSPFSNNALYLNVNYPYFPACHLFRELKSCCQIRATGPQLLQPNTIFHFICEHPKTATAFMGIYQCSGGGTYVIVTRLLQYLCYPSALSSTHYFELFTFVHELALVFQFKRPIYDI